MERHRVLFLTYWYPTLKNPSKGIFVKRHAEAISEVSDLILLHIDICKVTKLIQIGSNYHIDEYGFKTYVLSIGSRFPKLLYVALPLHYWIIKRFFVHHLKHEKFTHVHSNVIYPCGIIGYKLSTWLKTPHIITEHWTKIDKFFRISLYKYLGKKAYNTASCITAVSPMLSETIKRYTNTTIEIVPNVIDSQEFRIIPNLNKSETFTFIGVANWSQHKRPFYFLDALEKLKRENQIGPFRVILAGTGDQLKKIQSRNYSFPIDYIGVITGEELVNYFNTSHCFVHGSDYETFSVVIAEALQCGLPVVASPVGIANTVINESNGLISKSEREWEINLKKVYFLKFDPFIVQSSVHKLFDKSSISEIFKYIYLKT